MALRTFGEVIEGTDHVALSFNATNRWTVPDDVKSSARTATTPFDTTALLIGDQHKGPLLLFISVEPGFRPPDAPAHGHASDNFRISARGVLPIGPESYGEGEFRFQRGWKPYPSDNYAHGPDGGWSVLCFADRRGVRTRYVRPDEPAHSAADAKLAKWLGINGDLTSDDPAATAGPSALATNLGAFNKPFLNGSYARSAQWQRIDDSTHAGAALLGDRECGPLIILSTTTAGRLASSGFAVDTEVFHLVIRGSCTIGNVQQVAGDMRVQRAGHWMAPTVAGPDGVDEFIVIADRRAAGASQLDDTQGWSSTIRPRADELARALNS